MEDATRFIGRMRVYEVLGHVIVDRGSLDLETARRPDGQAPSATGRFIMRPDRRTRQTSSSLPL